MKKCFFFCILLAPFFFACGDDESSFGLNGLYTVDTWTLNEGGCDAEGASVKETHDETLMWVNKGKDPMLGIPFITVGTCGEAQACSNNAHAGIWGALFGSYVFESFSVKDGRYTTERTQGSSSNGQCTSDLVKATLSEGEVENTVVLRVERIKDLSFEATIEVDDDGHEWPSCEFEDAKKAAEGMPCGELEVITGTFSQDLLPAKSDE